MRLHRRLFATLAAFALAAPIIAHAQTDDPENTLVITLDSGDVVVNLRPDLAPRHVQQIKALAREGAYDNVAFHRVIDGFMAQTGDVQFGDLADGYNAGRVGQGGSTLPDLPAEFSTEPFLRGVVGMARAQTPDSANSQFFIMFDEGRFLDGQYTVVGSVVSGMELVDQIKRGEPVVDPDRMMSVRVAADQ